VLAEIANASGGGDNAANFGLGIYVNDDGVNGLKKPCS